MATLLEHNGWHPGERAVHALANVPTANIRNPTHPYLPAAHAQRVAESPLLAVGAIDDQGQPWTTIWGGERGFARSAGENILGVQSLVDAVHDPVLEALLGRPDEAGVRKPEEGSVMSALSIDLETRDRVKLAGRFVAGTVTTRPNGDPSVGEAGIAMLVQETLGNCPKYINKKDVRAHVPSPRLVSSSLPLPAEALALIEKADMFFLSSTNGQTMDTNHRGGPPGFVRVARNTASDGGVVLVYPEYSGNRFYQTLGNLHVNPRVGVAIPDFDTSDVLHLTGTTRLLAGAAAAALLPHTNLAVEITVHSARFVRDALSFRGDPGERSPYNPPLRRLASEMPLSLQQVPTDTASADTDVKATLARRDLLTPTIARFTFLLSSSSPPESGSKGRRLKLKPWQPGQHITLSFASLLSLGYRHMNEADPQSLNDDFVRTFTISSPPPPPSLLDHDGNPKANGEGAGRGKEGEEGVEIELTLRLHGPATKLLFSHPIDNTTTNISNKILEIPVLGVAGEERFRIPLPSSPHTGETEKKNVFVAGGVGITPLLAQAPGLLAAGQGEAAVEVLWSVREEDLGLVVDSFERVSGLGRVTRVFVTGHGLSDKGEAEGMVERARELGARVEIGRRMGREDVKGLKGAKWFVCAGGGMMAAVLGWLGEEGEEVVWESFEY